jgi:FAD/FMN-containing dehydrogenase
MDIDQFVARLEGAPWSREPGVLRRKSRDYYWYSPILAERLNACMAEVVVTPRDLADVKRIAAASAATGVPLTARGGGTGNYGQAMPLQGGAVVDMTGLDQLLELKDGVARVQAGATLYGLEHALRARGHELRMYPSTWHTATVGGFVAGGTGGIGSVSWGGLREPGNIVSATLVTVEDAPRVIELVGADCNLINRTFGTTGLLTELRIPVQPATAWREAIVAFDSLAQAIAFGAAWCQATGIQKRLCSVSDGPLAQFFEPFEAVIPPGRAIAALIVAASGLIATREVAAAHGGTVVLEQPWAFDDPNQASVQDLAFNHATLQVLKRDRAYTYLQSLYRDPEILQGLADQFGPEIMWHVEFLGFEGKSVLNGLPVFRFESEARLNEIIAIHEAGGAPVANPHVFTVEDGSRYKRLPGDQLSFKRSVDPKGLLNPGKMRTFVPDAAP